MLTSGVIQEALARMHARIDFFRDVLNAADRELGDGDTGMTVAQLITAWQACATELPVEVGAALVVLGKSTRRASGSSLAGVLAVGLSAAGKISSGREALDRRGIAAALGAAAAAIVERSGAAAEDKTVLDVVLRVKRDLERAESDGALLATALAAADAALDEFRGRESRLGRARIYGQKSIGRDDPGMLAAAMLLRAAADPGVPLQR